MLNKHAIPAAGIAAVLAAAIGGGTVALTRSEPTPTLPPVAVIVTTNNGTPLAMILDPATGLPICGTPQAARPVGYDGACSHANIP